MTQGDGIDTGMLQDVVHLFDDLGTDYATIWTGAQAKGSSADACIAAAKDADKILQALPDRLQWMKSVVHGTSFTKDELANISPLINDNLAMWTERALAPSGDCEVLINIAAQGVATTRDALAQYISSPPSDYQLSRGLGQAWCTFGYAILLLGCVVSTAKTPYGEAVAAIEAGRRFLSQDCVPDFQ
jgi:hypothetical protein